MSLHISGRAGGRPMLLASFSFRSRAIARCLVTRSGPRGDLHFVVSACGHDADAATATSATPSARAARRGRRDCRGRQQLLFQLWKAGPWHVLRWVWHAQTHSISGSASIHHRSATFRQIEHAFQIVEFANDRFRSYSIQ
jgi:hypothetical protein